MLQAMFNGVSGVQAHKTQLDIIGNNVANVNTVAFKASRTVFKDILSQTTRSATQPTENGLGGTNPFQVGLGVSVGSADPLLTQGSMQPTGKVTDVAIEGNGYLMTSDGTQKFYTRDGSFYIDSAGNLVSTGSGLHVLGWSADDETGRIDTSVTVTKDSNIKIFIGQSAIAKATSLVEFGGNLNAAQATGVPISKSVDIYDSRGVGHRLDVTFVKSDVDSTWFWHADSPDRADATAAAIQPGPTAAAAVTGTQSLAAPISLSADGVLEFRDSSGGLLTSATLVNGMSKEQIESAIDAAFSSVAEPQKVEASIDATGHLVLTNTTGGASSGITIGAGSTAELLTALGLSAGTSTGVGNYFTPPAADTTLTINHVTIPVYPTDTADSLAQRITGAGAGATATAAGGKISLTSQIKGSDTPLTVTAGNGYTVHDVFGTGFTSTSGTGTSLGSGTLTFDPDGNSQLDSIPITLALKDSQGATNPMQLALDVRSIGCRAGDISVGAVRQDGLQLGTLESISINKDGIITGRFNNGISKSLAQLALAEFRNPAGLAKSGNNLLIETSNSGLAQIGVPSIGSRGRITAGYLETSNVDLPTEFTNMIVAQRGFQANARLITTSDEVLQELVQLKR